jgi:hypothetical protein
MTEEETRLRPMGLGGEDNLFSKKQPHSCNLCMAILYANVACANFARIWLADFWKKPLLSMKDAAPNLRSYKTMPDPEVSGDRS